MISRYSSNNSIITAYLYLQRLMKYIRRGERMNNKKLLYVLVPAVICVLVLGIIFFPKSNPVLTDGNENEVVAVTENDATELPEETEETGSKVLDAPGTYSDDAEYTELTITSPDVVMENASIENLKIDATVGDGDVTLRNMSVTNLEIYGGGKNSIHIEGTTIENMVVARKEDAVRVVVDASSSINLASLDENTILEIEGEIIELNVNAESNLTIKGNVARLNVSEAAKDSTILVEGSVANLISEEKLTSLTGKNKVANLEIMANTNAKKTVQAKNKNKKIDGNATLPQSGGSDGSSSGSTPSAEEIVIERVQSEYAKVIVTLSAPTSVPIAKEQISILCHSGGSDMTILNVTTTDNKTYEISTAVYKDNEYEIYMTLPNGMTISMVFEVRNNAPTLTKFETTRINESNADLFFVSDSSGEFYYLLQESSALRATRSVPTADQVKSQGIKTSLNYQGNHIHISNLKPDIGYEIYYLAVDHNGQESLVQGPVYISSTPAQEPQQNAIQIVDAKATQRYFDITLSEKPAEELSLINFSIFCPALSSLPLGKMEKLSDTQYRLHIQEGYFFQDMNHYTIIITYSDKSISKYKFFVDLSWPTFSMPTVTRNSDTEAVFDFRSNEKGNMWYLCLDKDTINSGVTVDQVLSQGTMVSFVDGNNRIQLNGVTAASKSLFYVYEDLLGNRIHFVDAVQIPEKSPDVPQPPQDTVQIVNFTVSKDYGPKNECTVLSLEFDYDVQADQIYVSADDIEITQDGSSTIYTGSRDLEIFINTTGVQIKFIKNLGMILPDGQYHIKVQLNKGTATKTFTVQS